MDFLVTNALDNQHNFMWAVAQMKTGKKVKKELHKDTGYKYLYLDRDMHFFNSLNQIHSFSIYDIEATDWQIYEEEDNWNLAQFLKRCDIEDEDRYFTKLRIKTFIQKVKEDIKLEYGDKMEATVTNIINIIDKRSGDLK